MSIIRLTKGHEPGRVSLEAALLPLELRFRRLLGGQLEHRHQRKLLLLLFPLLVGVVSVARFRRFVDAR